MSRPSHAKKEVEQALKHAELQGWRVVVGGGHCWGKMYCPLTTPIAVVQSFASLASGVPPRILEISHASSGVSWITALATGWRKAQQMWLRNGSDGI